jgi:hypothetical protein
VVVVVVVVVVLWKRTGKAQLLLQGSNLPPVNDGKRESREEAEIVSDMIYVRNW